MRWLWIVEDILTHNMTYVVTDETDTIIEGGSTDEYNGKTIVNLAKDHNVKITSIGPGKEGLK